MVSQFMATTALASTNDIHSHCICGKTNCTEEGHDGDLTWTAWDSADSLPTTSGNYYLTTDVTLTKPWDYNRNQDVNLCLNGHSIYGADEPDEDGSWVIRVASGTNLAITDCHTGDQVGKITYKNVKHGGINNNGTLALWNGSITGNAMLGLGGGVCNGGTFTMYGGNITGNSAYAGGGVYNDGAFTMSGGNICGNSSTSGGGGVYDNDTFTMTGGSITDNSSTGGVFIGEFAGYAGGVYVIGTLNLSGDAVIKDNKAGDTVSNVEIEIASTTVSRYGTVAVTGPMGKNASVGITATEPSEKLTVVKDTTNTDVFFSDDGTYTLVADEANQVLYMVLTSSIPQEHKICGDATCQNQDHAILTWKAVWSLDDIKESGNYYLLSDLTLSNTWTCNYDVNLCLNGKTITGPADNATIKVAAGSSLTITDCHTDDQVGKITHNNGEAGNGIFVSSNDDSCGTLTLWKGNITGNSAEYGGVENYGTLNLYGGSIWGNTANSYGGGVYNSGTLNIEGGSIAENTAGRDGGGVYISYGSLSMSDGSITDNSAGRGGGGIYISYGSLTMSGGSITSNSATSNGGGVYNFGTFNLSGDVTIKDNTASNAANNVYLSNNKTIAVAKTGMGDGASVGITAQTPGNSPVVVSNTADTTGFSSDNTNYELLSCGSSGLKLVQVHMHKICGDAACQDQTHDTLRWTAVSSLDSITTDGNYYLLSNVSLSDTWTCNYNVNLCLNGKTITGASDQDAIKIASGKSLTITDCQETVGKITHKNGDSGRGIYNGDTGTLTIWNGSITDNSTKGQGGGVYNSGTLDMYGGSVTSNSAASNGGGVYNFGTFNLSGNVTIKDNTVDDEANNVYLPSTNETITVSETGMGDGASVGITSATPEEDPIVVAGTSLTKGFFSDNGMYGLTASDAGDALKLVDASTIPHNHTICGKTECEHAGHTSLKWKAISSLDSITTDGNYYLLLDVTLSDTWTCNYNVNLCLNGKTITGASDQDAIKIASGKSLTITDCQEAVGTITHKSGDSGRGIYNSGTLTLWNGTITKNAIKKQGGGVYNSGTLNMYGGSVTSNSATECAGGIYNNGTFTLSGNVIIKDNTVGDKPNNVYLPSTNETITVSETGMGDSASIGITSANPDSGAAVVTGTSDATYFSSDDTGYELVAIDGGGLKLSAKLVQISGVKLLVSDGGDEMATGQDGAKSKVYDGRAVAYDASAVVISPSTITGVTLSYTWQAKSGENYTDIADNEAPKDAGSYRLLVCAKRDDVVLGTFELPFTITTEEPIKPDSDKDKSKDETYDGTTDKSLVPATGDTSTATLPLALLGTAALATVLISGRRRRRR